MPVPSSIADLSTTPASNFPAGSDPIGTAVDDYMRSIQAIIKQNVSSGSDIASSSTITIPASGSYFIVTGNTTITAISDTNNWNGRTFFLEFSGTPQLTNSAGLVLPGATNYACLAGDVVIVIRKSTGVYKVSILRASFEATSGPNSSPFAFRNKIIGHFDINQRALTSVADDAYCCDRWYVLTESGNVTVGQVTDPESGAPFGWKLTQPDATAKRMGLATIIESKNVRAFRSAATNFYMRVKPSFAGNVRYAILEHTGTADTVTSDVVNDWTSATFTAGNFFIAGLNVIKTGTVAPGAATYGEFSDYGTMGASLNNAILFVWTESAQAQNATLELNRPQFELGIVHTPHEWRLDELSLCQRYYFKTFPQGTAPAQNAGTSGAISYSAGIAGANPWGVFFPFPVRMRAAPSVIAYNPSNTNANWRNCSAEVDSGANTVLLNSDSSITLRNAQVSGDLVSHTCGIHIAALAEL